MLFFGFFFIRGATGLRPLCIIKVVHVQYNRSVGTRIHSSHFVHARDTEQRREIFWRRYVGNSWIFLPSK